MDNPQVIEHDPNEGQAQHSIYVAYLIGKKGRHASRILQTPFEDIENSSQLTAAVSFLVNEHQDENITIINWAALDG